MAPAKSLPAAKCALALSFFRTHSLAYTLKDLEKLLPPFAGISGMLVKDYLAALVGDSLLSVEKIGSGNWYWSFASDAKRMKLNVIEAATKELDKLQAKQEAAEKEMAARAEAEEGGEDVGELVRRLRELRERKEGLKREVEGYRMVKVDGGEVERLKGEVNVFVDNIFSLLGYVKEITGNDPETMTAVREQFGIEEELDYLE